MESTRMVKVMGICRALVYPILILILALVASYAPHVSIWSSSVPYQGVIATGIEGLSHELPLARISDGVVEIELIATASRGEVMFRCPDRPSYATCTVAGSRGLKLSILIMNRGVEPILINGSSGISIEVLCRDTVFTEVLGPSHSTSVAEVPAGYSCKAEQPLFYEKHGDVYTLTTPEICREPCIAVLTIRYRYGNENRALLLWLSCALKSIPVELYG